ncbi:MAG: HAMP domain-containing histidine kinase [Verrucomicrobiae bacterium]|nr:HAMP domain-containing histidine kinase [Verrucomicrobiae bacterium]
MSPNHTQDKPQRNFAFELNLQYTLFFILSASILFYVAYKNIYDYVKVRDEQALKQRLLEYKDWYEGGGIQRLNQRFCAASSLEQESFFIRIVDEKMNILFHSDPNLFTNSVPSQVTSNTNLRASQRPREAWIFIEDRLADGRHIQVGKSVNDSVRLLLQMRNVFILTMAGSALLVFSGGAYMTRRALQPIRRMTEIAQNIISTGNLDDRVPSHKRRDELDNLAHLFNTMLDRNQSLIRGMREALDNVAHGLRTPMTRLRASMETGLQSSGEDIQKIKEALADGMEESDRVLTILKVLMDVSEAEAGMLKLHKSVFNAKVLLLRVMDLYEFVAEDAKIQLKTESLFDMQIHADQTRLGQVLVNLVDNAIKYTEPGGAVSIGMENTPEHLAFFVADDGIGISPSEQTKIWQRLYRCDTSRSQKGLGLGLCIVRAVVEAHGGTVKLESELGKGSRFTLLLPHSTPPASGS